MSAQWQRKNLSSCPKLVDHYILKQILGSRLAGAASLLATATLYFGPKFIKNIPTNWEWLVFGIMIFTGGLCGYWAWESFKRALAAGRKAIFKLTPRKLTEPERSILGMLILFPNESIYIDDLVDRGFLQDKLALYIAKSALTSHGLIWPNMLGGDSIRLSDDGRRFILKYRKELGG